MIATTATVAPPIIETQLGVVAAGALGDVVVGAGALGLVVHWFSSASIGDSRVLRWAICALERACGPAATAPRW